jgi:hypothetical protein
MSTADLNLILGFLVNLVVAVLIIRFIYYPAKQNKNYVFTFLAFNTIIYFVMSTLATSTVGVGVGFGLFAIFSVLRYRTITMPTREMTYLFTVIGLPVVNSVLMQSNQWVTLLIANSAVVIVMFILEREWGFHYESTKTIRYERIDLVKPEQYPALLADLEQRTGLTIKRFEIGRFDFLQDSAELKIYYDEPRSQRWSSSDELGQADD